MPDSRTADVSRWARCSCCLPQSSSPIAVTRADSAGLRKRTDDQRRRIELRVRRHRPVGGRDQLDRRRHRQLLTSSSVIGLNEFAQQQVDFGASEIGYSTGQANQTPPPATRTSTCRMSPAPTCMMLQSRQPHNEPADHVARPDHRDDPRDLYRDDHHVGSTRNRWSESASSPATTPR